MMKKKSISKSSMNTVNKTYEPRENWTIPFRNYPVKSKRYGFMTSLLTHAGLRWIVRTVKNFIGILEAKTSSLNMELTKITAGKVTKGTQVQGMMAYLNEGGAKMTSLDKKSVADAIKEGRLTKNQIRVLRLRQQLGKSSLAKYRKLVAAVDKKGILRDSYMYHSASTGRWGGKLVQLQNLDANKKK